MNIETELQTIKERNERVELSKAWEVSLTRRMFIASITYVAALIFLWVIHAPAPYLAAFVPVGGYVLSTLSLPFLRNRWIAHRKK